jgi:hypothetical protein
MIIQDRETLDKIFEVRFKYNRNFEANMMDVPEEIKAFVRSGEKVRPEHCTPGVIEELYIEKLKKRQPLFTQDENCAPVIKSIALWIARSGDFTGQSPHYGLNKGIMLLGGIGAGKTLLMSALADLYFIFDTKVKVLPTYVVTEKFSKFGVEAYDKVNYSSDEINPVYDHVIFDDLGAETIQSHYGQITNVMAEVMLRRYDNNVRTFGTSNLDQKTIRKFYGERVWSRMKSMFNFIELKGDDRRN